MAVWYTCNPICPNRVRRAICHSQPTASQAEKNFLTIACSGKSMNPDCPIHVVGRVGGDGSICWEWKVEP